MAAGSQAENGIWALFVHAASLSSSAPLKPNPLAPVNVPKRFKSGDMLSANVINRALSPKRFLRAVIIPAFKDLLL